jgi:hypothetical protein
MDPGAGVPALGSPATAAEIRARLGRLRTGAGPDIRALAEVVVGEKLLAVAVATRKRRGWVLAATDRGLRMTRRPRLFGRTGEECFPWEDLTCVWSGGMNRVDLDFGDRSVALGFVSPPDEYSRLLETARRHAYGDDGRSSADEIRQLARSTLGQLLASAHDDEIEGVPDRLEPGERVAVVASAFHRFTGLLAVTQSRVLLLDVSARAGKSRVWTVDRSAVGSAEPTGGDLRLDTADGPILLKAITPAERLDELASLLSPREPRGPPAASHITVAVPDPPVAARLPVSRGAILEGAVRERPLRYAVTAGGGECGRLLLAPNHAAYEVVTRTEVCDLWVTAKAGSWVGVAAGRGREDAIAGYYPGLLWDGTLIFDEYRYRLREKRLAGGWQLRDRRGVLARLRYLSDDLQGGYVSHTWPMRVEIGAGAEEVPEADLLIMLFIWVVGLETSVPRLPASYR